jgi:hypothetical protein
LANTTDFEVITKLNDLFLSSLNHPTISKGITNAIKDFEFREGRQWTDAEINKLQERGQPDIVENEILPRVNRLLGQYKQMKTRIKFRGRNLQQDEPIANILSDIMLYIQQKNQYEFEEAEMVDDAFVCGMGVVEVKVEYDESYQAEVVIRQEDRLNIFPDPYSSRYDWEDANFICRSKWVSLSEAKALYPKKVNELNGLSEQVVAELLSIDTLKNNTYYDERLKRIRLVEVWYRVKEKKIIAVTDSDMIDVTNHSEAKLNALRKKGATVAEKLNPKVKMGVFCANVLFEDRDSPYEHGKFPFVPYFVYRKKNGEPYSLVRSLIDPQTEINKRRSKALHLLNTNQIIMGEGAVRDKDDIAKEAAKPDGVMEVRKFDQFELVKNIDLAATQMQLLSESKDAIKRISGISDEAMGMRSEIRSGTGLARKQAMTDTIIAPIFENLRRTRLLVGNLVYELIKQYYTEEKIFSITDDVKSKQIVVTKDHLQAIKERQYDIIVEEAPDTTTLQDEQFRMMSEMIQTFSLPPDVAMSIFPLMIQMSQLRNKDEILKQLMQMRQPTPMQPKMSLQLTWDNLTPPEKSAFAQMMGLQQLAQQEMQQPVEPSYMTKEKAGIQKIQIKAQADMQNTASDPIVRQQDMQIKQTEHQMDLQHKAEKHQTDMQLEQQKTQLALQQQANKGRMDMVGKMVDMQIKAKQAREKGN